MTIEQIGSIGELIAAFATIATLIYLARQIRASAVVAKVESRRQEATNGTDYLLSIVENQDVARIFLAGMAQDPNLSPEDRTRFAMLMGLMVSAEAAFFDEVSLGLGAARRIEDRAASIVPFLASPGGRAWWERFGSQYGPEFHSFYQSKLDAAGRAV